MLLAVGILVAGYGFALSLRRAPIAAVERPAPAFAVASLPAPSRLAPHRSVAAVSASAATDVAANDYRDYRVRLRGTAAAQLGGEAGLAVLAPRTGNVLCWVPLSSGTAGEGGAIDLPVRAPAREVVLTLSRAPHLAHHGYLARREVRLEAQPAAPIEFVADASPIQLVLEATVKRAGPLQLARIGNPEWQPLDVVGAGIFLDQDGALLLLGTGDYDLVDPIDPSIRQRFSAPAPGPIRVTDRLARPRGPTR